jgi:ribosome biogenesis GTPase A
MSKIMTCKGCGAVLQGELKEKIGYTPSIDREYCQSCYRLLHYGESLTHFHPQDLPSLPIDALIVMMSSVLHLDCLFSYPVYRYQPEGQFVYVINQIDLLPQQTNTDNLVESIFKKAKQNNVPLIDVILMSSKNPYDIESFKKYIRQYKSKHIYLIGVQNSGKTTLFKALTLNQEALSFKKAALTQMPLLGHFENKTIYDMPGLYQKGYLHEFLSYEVYKNLIPDQEIKPRIYQLKKDQALVIEGLFQLTLETDDTTFVLYLDAKVEVHRTQKKKIQNLMTGDFIENKIHVNAYEEKSFRIPNGKHQLTLADMGFIHLEGPSRVHMTYPKGIHLTLSEALFK